MYFVMQVSRIQLLTSKWSCKGVVLFPYIASKHLSLNECGYSTASKDGELVKSKPTHKIGKKVVKIPDPPTNCCMSGCQNCVWLEYAEELKNTLCTSSEESMKMILEQITDPNMKAFLKFEMSHRSNGCRYRPNSSEEPGD